MKFYIKRKKTANNVMVFVTNRQAEMFMRKGPMSTVCRKMYKEIKWVDGCIDGKICGKEGRIECEL